MKYLGIYSTNFSDKSRCLYSYLENVEIVIVLRDDNSFFINKVCVSLEITGTYSTYDVFEINKNFNSDIDAKLFANTLAENVIKYRQSLLKYYKTFFT